MRTLGTLGGAVMQLTGWTWEDGPRKRTVVEIFVDLYEEYRARNPLALRDKRRDPATWDGLRCPTCGAIGVHGCCRAINERPH